MIRIAMVEDSDAEAAVLQEHIQRYGRERHLTTSVAWFKSAVEFIEGKRSFDLIFFDIGLPGISGMETAELVRTYDTDATIIFVTNLAQYAVQGYKVNALDFLLKPVSYFNFVMIMDKAIRIARRKEAGHIVVETREQAHVIPYENLVYVAVNNHKLSFSLAEPAEVIEARGSLRSVEQRLAGGPFVLISSSCLVNMNFIRSYRGDSLFLTNGETLYFSRPKRSAATERIAAFFGGSI